VSQSDSLQDILGQRAEMPEAGEKVIQRKLGFIHALSKHLLHVNDIDAQNLFVGVQPLGNGWRVQVSFSGFLLEKKALDLSDALEQALQHLMEGVSKRLEEGAQLLNKIET